MSSSKGPSTRFARLRFVLVVAWVAFGAFVPASGDAHAANGPSKYAAPAAALEAGPGGDLSAEEARGLLQACDTSLKTAQLEVRSSGYLRAAYIAIWLILLVFLVLARRGQLRLASEVAELRARLLQLDKAAGGKT